MALEAVVFPQDHFGYGCKNSPYTLPWCDMAASVGGGEVCGDWDPFYTSLVQNLEEWEVMNSKAPEVVATATATATESEAAAVGGPAVAVGRRKRRRTKVVKNKEEIESQRMTHIAVERNRRKQMNEYLAVLRSLMPPSYAQRGDQASIVGGAINYVKELEQLLQSLQVQKSLKQRNGSTEGLSPFAGFFSFPQYSSSHHSSGTSGNANIKSEMTTESRSAIADIEVTMVEGHANLKVLAPRRPKQLLKLVAGLQQLRVPPLHLNMTMVDAMVLYSFSLKVEEDSKFNSVEEIATAVHEILGRIQEEAGFS